MSSDDPTSIERLNAWLAENLPEPQQVLRRDPRIARLESPDLTDPSYFERSDVMPQSEAEDWDEHDWEEDEWFGQLERRTPRYNTEKDEWEDGDEEDLGIDWKMVDALDDL